MWMKIRVLLRWAVLPTAITLLALAAAATRVSAETPFFNLYMAGGVVGLGLLIFDLARRSKNR